MFPYADDCGVDIADIPYFIVYNGIDHYCGVRYPGKTFKDGCSQLYKLLSQPRAISDNLSNAVQAPVVKDVVKKCSESNIASLYAVDQLMESAYLVNLEEICHQRKSSEVKRKKRREKPKVAKHLLQN